MPFFFFFLVQESFKIPQNDLLTVYIVQKDIPFLEYPHPSPQKEGPDKNYNLAYHIICWTLNLKIYMDIERIKKLIFSNYLIRA